MHRLRRKLKEFVWVALLAFGGLAVAPTISRAIHLGAETEKHAAMSGQAPMVASGSQHVHHHIDPATDPVPHSGGHRHSLDHCALCVIAASAYTLVSMASVFDPSPAVYEGVQLVFRATPRLRQSWSPASPRGPPFRI